MRILLIHPHDLWSSKEPWTTRIYHIAQTLVKKGHEVRVICFAYPGDHTASSREHSFILYRLQRAKRVLFKHIQFFTKQAQWADIIHFQKCFAHGSIPALYAHVFTDTPIHYDWDDWEYQIYNYDPPSLKVGIFLKFLENSMPGLVDTISVASKGLKEVACSLGFPEERIFPAHVCADLETFRPLPAPVELKKKYHIDKPVVMYMGQLHGAQYAELFIAAARGIIRQRKDVLFMIVGAGAREQVLLQYAIEQGLGKHIIFTGAIEHEKIPQYLALCDVAVACFKDNNITRCKSPLKIAEYLACGKAIVASDVGEIPFMLKGSGVLTKPGDVSSLSCGIMDLLENSNKRRFLEKKARRRAEEEFYWDITVDHLLEAYTVARSFYE